MKTTTQNQIMDYLQWSSEEYEQKMFITYFNWCHKYGKTPNIVQSLLANSRVSNWFMTEYTKLENQFIEMLNHYPKNIKNLNYHYQGFATQIFTIYPKPLIDELKVNESFKIKLIAHSPEIYAN